MLRLAQATKRLVAGEDVTNAMLVFIAVAFVIKQ